MVLGDTGRMSAPDRPAATTPSDRGQNPKVPPGPAEEPGRAFELTAILIAYVLPLAVFTVVLIAAHLPLIAGALLAVEALVVLAIVIARRRPQRPAGMAPPTRRPWLIPAAMIAIFTAIVGVALLAASSPA